MPKFRAACAGSNISWLIARTYLHTMHRRSRVNSASHHKKRHRNCVSLLIASWFIFSFLFLSFFRSRKNHQPRRGAHVCRVCVCARTIQIYPHNLQTVSTEHCMPRNINSKKKSRKIIEMKATTGQQQRQLSVHKHKTTTETTIWRPKIDLFQEITGNGMDMCVNTILNERRARTRDPCAPPKRNIFCKILFALCHGLVRVRWLAGRKQCRDSHEMGTDSVATIDYCCWAIGLHPSQCVRRFDSNGSTLIDAESSVVFPLRTCRSAGWSIFVHHFP